MTAFRYTAIAADGTRLTGTMTASSSDEVMLRLRRQGAMPVRAAPADARREGWSNLLRMEFRFRRGAGGQTVAVLIRELATMLAAGQDLDRALRYLQETAPARMRAVAGGLRDAVRDGSPLSDAMGRYPTVFTPLQAALVRAGEAGGELAPALTRLADMLDRQRSLSSAVVSALIYPALLLVAMTGAVALLVTQVLPQFVPMFEQNGVQPPASIRTLMAAGDVVQNHGVLLLAGLCLCIVAASAALRAPAVRLGLDTLLLRLPVAGPIVREVLAARFTRVLGTLLVNGVALIPALRIVRDAIGNRLAQRAVERASLSTRGGGALTPELEQAGIFPVRTIHLLRLGEETAQIGPMALRAADIHDEQTRVATQRLMSLLVPVLTILMGLAVGGIVASLMSAMLSLNNLAAG